MEAMRQSWTDDRMDDLVKRVDDGFAHVDARFAEVHSDLAALRIDNKEIRKEMATRQDIDAINRRLDTLQWTINGGILSGIFTVVVSQLI